MLKLVLNRLTTSMLLQVLRSWRWLSRSQWLSRDELMKIQSRKLRDIVSHAYERTVFYRRLYGNQMPSISSVRDIRRLPIITKEIVRKTPLEERIASGTDVRKCVRKTTTGTTGIPITVLEDPASAAYLDGLHLRRLWSYGVRPHYKIVRIVSGPLERAQVQTVSDIAGLWGKIRTKRIVRLSAAGEIQEHLIFLTKFRPDVLVAPPSYFRALKEACESNSKYIALRIAVTWGELLDGRTRRMVSDFFGAEVFDGYGCTEVAPIGGLAWECPTHTAYHINIDSVVLEFLRDGEEVSAGESGEVVATSLFRWATPMIRYYLGDMATPLDDECPCGRGLPLLKNIEGRVVDFIRRPDGGSVSPYAIMHVLQDVSGLEQFKVVQRNDYSIEVLVRVSGDLESVLNEVENRCNLLFRGLRFRVFPVESIRAGRGEKFRVVESHVTV